MTKQWPFEGAPDTTTITTVNVLAGHPILLVTHDADDGMWQCLCGTTDASEDARVVALSELYERDPSIGELADLPLGWRAWRADLGATWQRSEVDA